ncbi:MAG: metallophosphoesterase family protein [Chloroflexi bacterium]|nr:metallophosphoesterase family protein [Chloroflexota bacterium]
MKIGLISDTHLPNIGQELPPQINIAFAGVDLILHAGDIYNSACLDWLERIAPIIAVEVPPALAMNDPRVALRRVVELEGYRIGLVHDITMRGIEWEVTPGIMAKKWPQDWSLPEHLETFFGKPVDIVVFGHTHITLIETHQGVLFINPGSPTLPRQVRRLGAVAILELTPAGAEAKIIELGGLGF